MNIYKYRNEKGQWIEKLGKKITSTENIGKAKAFEFKNRGEAEVFASTINIIFNEYYRPLNMPKK